MRIRIRFKRSEKLEPLILENPKAYGFDKYGVAYTTVSDGRKFQYGAGFVVAIEELKR
jgi:hypothetical protein